MSLRAALAIHKSYGSTSANSTRQQLNDSELRRHTSNFSGEDGDGVEDDMSSPLLASEGKVVERRQIGVFSAVFIIFNRIIGTG
jgi:hypothetical protein